MIRNSSRSNMCRSIKVHKSGQELSFSLRKSSQPARKPISVRAYLVKAAELETNQNPETVLVSG